jgi:acetyl-CoA/propionyl-CoA carboxylase biotin carboxyl carrier protein
MERSQMMESVLVANRGEIAVRIMRTLRALGIASIGVYSDADRDARHVVEADMAVRLGPAPAQESYLSVPAILAAVASSGAAAVHPGYGFLSENAGFARAVIDAGAVWIGPPPAAIDAMGDKIRAKATVAAAGVPVVPGRTDPGLSDDELVAAALDVGLPVLIKPSAGGGGKGMHRVESASDLRGAIAAARREAAASFGDDTLLVERWVTRPRHIEVQIFADTRSTVVHLGERECSLQRRHQKIVEEAPSPLLDEATRARLGASAVDAARACGYVGAGTVEFIVSADRPQEYFFLEMNTRLQVEHPVTEAVTGLDLVEAQLRVAAGERLAFGPEAAQARGHAMEARVYAEDPARGFLPASGTILALHEPQGPGIRVDSSLATGTTAPCWPRSSPGGPTGRKPGRGWSEPWPTPGSWGSRRTSGSWAICWVIPTWFPVRWTPSWSSGSSLRWWPTPQRTGTTSRRRPGLCGRSRPKGPAVGAGGPTPGISPGPGASPVRLPSPFASRCRATQ